MDLPTLNSGIVDCSSSKDRPVTILQIGEGNFLRGFFDWMIHECVKQGLYNGSIALVQPRPTGASKIKALEGQDGLYTLVTRGLEKGELLERKEIVSVFSTMFDPYSDWEAFLSLGDSPDLQCVVSNTTEAGLKYRPEKLELGKPVASFPGKVTLLLYRRYSAFAGDPDKGLIFMPCELLEHNGDVLKNAVLQYAADWQLPEQFRQWVREHNRFLNSLVDRIVPGYPSDELAEEWFRQWGYRDELAVMAEPYHLWAIEAGEDLESVLPMRQAGLNVHWVNDLKPYHERKVRILNGAHALMAFLGVLGGIATVRELMANPQLDSFVREVVEKEIIPMLPYPEKDLQDYALTVYERFRNPYVDHRLLDITMNGVSKFRTRVIPILNHYLTRHAGLPERISYGFAALLRYYKVRNVDGRYWGADWSGNPYVVREDEAALQAFEAAYSSYDAGHRQTERLARELLSLSDLWGSDLSMHEELVVRIGKHLEEMEARRN